MTFRARLIRCVAIAVASGAVALPVAAVEPVSEPQPAAARAHAVPGQPDCLRDTGSRITAAHNQRVQRMARRKGASATAGHDDGTRCVSAHGRVYRRDDLDRTGAIDVADALRQLDPAIH